MKLFDSSYIALPLPWDSGSIHKQHHLGGEYMKVLRAFERQFNAVDFAPNRIYLSMTRTNWDNDGDFTWT